MEKMQSVYIYILLQLQTLKYLSQKHEVFQQENLVSIQSMEFKRDWTLYTVHHELIWYTFLTAIILVFFS
jgi:hypothetical protein